MNKRIVLPTDFSKNALNAIRYALQLYEHETCDFYFLNAYQIKGYSIDSLMVPEPGEKFYEAAKKDSENQFDRLMDILSLHNTDNPKHTYHTISTYNALLYALKDVIAKKDIDIVIMGTKGATGSDSVIFGTNAIDAMENITECPVLAVPENVRFAPPKEIVFPTDYNTNFKRKELKYMIEIALHHKAAIRVLHIVKQTDLSKAQQNNKELLRSILEGTEHSYHTLNDLKVQSGINAFIESRGSDMIAFINKKHSFLEASFPNHW